MLINNLYTDISRNIESRSICRSVPWQHFVLDNFINPSDFERISNQILDNPWGLRINIADPQRIQYAPLENVELAAAFLSIEFVKLLYVLTGKITFLNEANAIQLRRAGIETPSFPVHVDTPEMGKSFIAILYISNRWRPEFGGQLYLHKTKRASSQRPFVVEPIPNRLVIFASKLNHWHSVEKVKVGERYSVLSEWLVAESF